MIFNEIKCHVNTSLGLLGGFIPCITPCVRASSCCWLCTVMLFRIQFYNCVFDWLFWSCTI